MQGDLVDRSVTRIFKLCLRRYCYNKITQVFINSIAKQEARKFCH